MAFRGNSNGNNKQKRISYTLGTIFSAAKNGEEYQMVKVGFYDEKLTFNFYKGVTGSGASKMIEAFTRLDYETTVALTSILNQIIRSRVAAYRAGQQYKNDIVVDYNICFTDSETKQLRSVGHIIIRTEDVTGDGKYAVTLSFNNGTDEFKIVLSSPYIPQQLSFAEGQTADIDLNDARLYALAYLLSNTSRLWPVLVQNDIIARLMMSRFSAICTKLGIYSDSNNNGNKGGKNDGNYSDSQYHGNHKKPIDSDSDNDAGGGSDDGDIPF